MSYMGIEWTFENDMATIHCPYEKRECKLKHEYLQEHGVLRYDCEVHMTEEEYCYEGSVEHILKLHDDEIRRQEVGFGLQKKGRVCREHIQLCPIYLIRYGRIAFTSMPSLAQRFMAVQTK